MPRQSRLTLSTMAKLTPEQLSLILSEHQRGDTVLPACAACEWDLGWETVGWSHDRFQRLCEDFAWPTALLRALEMEGLA